MPDFATITHEGVEISASGQTDDQLRAELQAPAPTPLEPVPPPKPNGEAPIGEPPEPEPAPESDAGKTLAKHRKSLQARIDGLTREKYDTQRERDEARHAVQRLEREIAELRKPTNGDGRSPVPERVNWAEKAERFPKYAEYLQSHPDAELEEWMEARDEWRDARRTQQEQARTQQEQRARSFNDRTSTFVAKIREAEKTDPELRSKVDPRLLNTPALSALPPGELPTFGNFLVEQITKSEHPAKLLLHLSHEDNLQRLADLDPDQVIRELARIDYGLDSAPSRPAAPTPPISQAHPPIKPLGGSPHIDADAPPGDDATDEEFRQYWNRKDLARHHRG